LDALPILRADDLPLPHAAEAELVQALGLELDYSKPHRQVTVHATITPTTPTVVAAIIGSSEPPSQWEGGSFGVLAGRNRDSWLAQPSQSWLVI